MQNVAISQINDVNRILYHLNIEKYVEKMLYEYLLTINDNYCKTCYYSDGI